MREKIPLKSNHYEGGHVKLYRRGLQLYHERPFGEVIDIPLSYELIEELYKIISERDTKISEDDAKSGKRDTGEQ